jgi:acyl-coenzyme A synthetase/AMP-(fatty) acid ligase/thioesterase domain-containing protein/acyl carrier protein
MALTLNREETLLSRLDEQFNLHSDRPALKTESTAWSYAELDALSANCARYLQQGSQDRTTPVALLMNHDAALVAAIIGVLRSGGFYLALNPAFPFARLRQIMSEVNPRAIIADREHDKVALKLIGSKSRRLLSDELLAGEGYCSTLAIAPNAPYALFYTSGSSGRPKPLVYTHGGALQSVTNHSRLLHIVSEDRITLLSPCSAAASVPAMLGALLNGACLLPFQPVVEGLHKMEAWITKNRITIYHSVASLFRSFVKALSPGAILSTVRAVRLAGETVFASDVELFREHFMPGTVLVNGLGLTEANGNVCHFSLTTDGHVSGLTVPIGQPDEGIDLKLFDGDGGEVASGEIGEIVVRGKQISPAHWTGTTVKSHTLDSAGWFHTGDLARRNSEGNLEYVGRRDGQLKLRGQWICIAEIEALLTQLPGVRGAAVVPVNISEQEKRIVAFVSWSQRAFSEQKLRAVVSQQSPAHSIPNRFFEVSHFPMLPNGKVDRRVLIDRATNLLAAKTGTACDPSDSVAHQLSRIWREILQTDRIGVRDDFFLSGGDSLAAATMLAAVEKSFGVSIPTSSLLEAGTIEELARIILERRGFGLESSLVSLQSRGSRPPLYCVPAAGADPLQFRHLASHLGTGQPLFAFQPQGLINAVPFQRSVEEMAANYVACLRAQQPQGPYQLCGASFGGVIAFEMAKQILEIGDEIRFLGLLDTYNSRRYPKRRRDLHLKQRLRLTIEEFLTEGTRGLSWKAFKWWLKVKAVRSYVRLIHRPLVARPIHWRSLYFREICYAASSHYCSEPIALKIHLFRVGNQPSMKFYERDLLLGWSGMGTEGIEVHELPGDHALMLQKPNVAVLASKLETALENVPALKNRTSVKDQSVDAPSHQ